MKNSQIEKIYPLSPMQANLLFAYLVNPQTSAYHQQLIFEFSGNLSIAFWEKSLQLLVNQYDILRTVLVFEKIKEPMQVVLKERKAVVFFQDWTNEPLLEEKLQTFQKEDLKNTFDLSKDLLLRVSIVRIATDRYRVFWTYHHILMDGSSRQILLQDFFILYKQLLGGITPQISQKMYQPFVQAILQKNTAQTLDFWKNYLQSYSSTVGFPQKNLQTSDLYLLQEKDFKIKQIDFQQIKKICQENAVTTAQFFQVAWALLLMRYNDTDDVVFGSVQLLHSPQQTESVGLQINTVPLRYHSPYQKDSFLEFLKKSHSQLAEIQENNSISLAEIQALHPLRNHLFDHILIYENYAVQDFLSSETLSHFGFEIRLISNHEHSTYPLQVVLLPSENELEIRLAFDATVYEEKIIHQIGHHFYHLIQQIIHNPYLSLQHYSLFDVEEISKIHQISNLKGWKIFQEQNLSYDFLTQIKGFSKEKALLTDTRTLHFSELLRLVGFYQDWLQSEIKIEKGDVIAISLGRSVEGIAISLAVFGLRAIYVPIDTTYPIERQQYILQDSQPKYHIIPENLPTFSLDKNVDVHILPFDEDTIAYRVYTSGTTGKPKGTDISYSNLNGFIKACQEIISLNEGEKVLYLANPAFDIALFECFFPLSQGKAVQIFSSEKQMDLVRLQEALQKVTAFHAVPALLGQITRFLDEPMPHIRHVWTGGDKVPIELTQEIEKMFPNAEIKIFYGPTETTILASVYAHQPNRILTAPIIGKPLHNSALLVLDKYGHFLPPQVVGELYIGGWGVGKGYFNEGVLTQQKFKKKIIDPQSEINCYQSGDYVRYNTEGEFEFVGRKDNQFKIRGQRVELQEIEQVIQILLPKTKALVLAEMRENIPHLIAFVESENEHVAVELLSERLRQRLPDFMIPAQFVFLKEFPLNENGKVHTKALLHTAQSVLIAEAEDAQPNSSTEQYLIQLWNELFPSIQVHSKSHFFEIGGHSLKAIVLISRIKKEKTNAIEVKDIFQYPRLKDFAQRLETLDQPTDEPILPAPPQAHYPVSSLQRRLLILEELDQDAKAYWLEFFFYLVGDWELEKLQDTLLYLLQRHEVLRTCFVRTTDNWVQHILPFEKIGWKKNNSSYQIQLDLLHITLQFADDYEKSLHFRIHHLLTDGYSMQLLLQELWQIYKGSPMPVPTLQYKDFAVWETQNLTHKSLSFWLKKFQTLPPLLDLPTDWKRPLYQNFEGDEYFRDIPTELTTQILQFCQQHHTTPHLLLLSVFYHWLARYTSQTDLTVGVPISGRYHADLENMQGLFVNILPMRVQLIMKHSFLQFLQEVQQYATEAYSHQQFSFQTLVEQLHLPRDTSRNPLFDISFAFYDFPIIQTFDASLKVEWKHIPRKSAMFDLALEVFPQGDVFKLRVEYSTQLFQKNTIQKMIAHFVELLENCLQNPQTPLYQLQLLPKKEKTKLMKWGNLGKDFQFSTSSKSILEVFEQTALHKPEKIALITQEKQLTYQKINQLAEDFADYLAETYSVTQGQVIGVSLPRNEELFIALLAIWKLGALFLPIDTQMPPERKAYCLSATNCSLILTHVHHPLALSKRDTVLLDNQSIAYIIFTSGSTGTPKGVGVTHQNLMSITQAWQEAYSLKQSVCLQLASFSFDVFMGDIGRSWGTGGTLVVADEITRQIPEEILEWIEKFHITHFETTPLMARLLTDTLEKRKEILPRLLASLRYWIVGSDVWYWNEWKKLKHLLPSSVTLVNSYGLTETTIDSTYFTDEITDYQEDNSIVPLGKPFANTQILVLDSHQQSVPIGVWGELWIGGEGVSLHSFGNRSVENCRITFPEFSTHFFYATGDVVRWNRQGFLEFKGRTDLQIKWRGFRIDLHEIEQHLSKHPQITHTVAGLGEEVIWASYESKSSLDVEILRKHCQNFLPTYMIPAVFYWVEKMPSNASGKIDRKEIQKQISSFQTISTPKLSENFTPLQQQIAEIWQSLLPISSLKLEDNFFEKGGNSLKAVQLSTRIHAQLDYPITLRDIFLYPTLYTLSKRVKELQKTENQLLIPIERDSISFIPLSPAQRRMWMLSQMQLENNAYNLVHLYFIKGNLEVEKLNNVFLQIFQRHDILRTNFKTHQGLPHQWIVQSTDFQLPVHYLENEKALEPFIKEEFAYTFDLENESLIRVKLLQLSENEFFLLFNVHHIIFDGWSDAILLKEMLDLYQGKRLTSLGIQYADYTLYQLQKDHQKARQYWLSVFERSISPLQLPTDFERSSVVSHQGNFIKTYLSASETTELKDIFQTHHITLFMGLTAIWSLLLAEMAQQNDVVIGTVIAGRNHPSVENLIGLFLNSLAIRCLPTPYITTQAYLEQIRNTVINAFEYQDYPIEELISELTLPYDTARNPLFDVALILQNYEMPTFEIEELEIRPLPIPYTAARLDLTLYVQEIGEKLEFHWEYNTDLFLEKTIQSMAGKLIDMCRLLSQNIQKTVGDWVNISNLPEQKGIPQPSTPVFNEEKIISDKTILQIQAILSNIINVQDIPITANFFQMGLHSLNTLQFLYELNRAFSTSLTLRKLYENPTILQLSPFVRDNTQRTESKVLFLNQHTDNQCFIFFIPPILGSATVFSTLAQRLSVNAIGLSYSGIEEGEELEKSILSMAERMANEIIRFPSEKGEYTLLGYSMGCLVAYEIAQILEKLNLKTRLFLLDKSVENDVFTNTMEENEGEELDNYMEKLWNQLQTTEQNDFYTSYVNRIKKMYQHHLQLIAQYQQTGQIRAEIIALEATENQPNTQMEKWKPYTSGKFEHHWIEGSHYTLLEERSLDLLVDFLEQRLKNIIKTDNQ